MEAGHTTSPGPSHHEDLWTCHRCGWTYPNAHPSAKHRRNHKKHCGKIKGFELHSEIHMGGSSDEASSDEEGHANKGHLSHQSLESMSSAAAQNLLPAAEATGSLPHPVLCAESQTGMGRANSDLSREFSNSKEKVSDGLTVEENLFKAISTSPHIQGEGSIQKPVPDGAKGSPKSEKLSDTVSVKARAVLGLLQNDIEQKQDSEIDELQESPHSKTEAATVQGPSRQEDLWACHRCGWTYPNPHPSAKHRRNHKKHCGKIKGFELHSEVHKGGSSDEASSDEEHEVDKGCLSNQSPELLHEQYEAIGPAESENLLSVTEVAGTCAEGSSASDESRELNISDRVNVEGPSFRPIATSPLIKGEDSLIDPSLKDSSSNKQLDNSTAEEEKPIIVEALTDLLQQDTEQKRDPQMAKLELSFSAKETSITQKEDMYVSLEQRTDGNGVQVSGKRTGAYSMDLEEVSHASAKPTAEKNIAEHPLDSEEMVTTFQDTVVADGVGHGGLDTMYLSGEETDKAARAFEPGTSEEEISKCCELERGGELPVKEDICPSSGSRVGDLDTAAEELERVDEDLPVAGQNGKFDETVNNSFISHMPVSESVNVGKGVAQKEVQLDAVSSHSYGFGVKKDGEEASVSIQDTENQTGHSSEQALSLVKIGAIGLNNPSNEETADIVNNVDFNAERRGQPDNLSSNMDSKACPEDMSLHKAFPSATEGQRHSGESAQIDGTNESKEVNVASETTKDQISESPGDDAQVNVKENCEDVLHGVVLTPDMTNKERSFGEGSQQDNTARTTPDEEVLLKKPESGDKIEEQDVYEITQMSNGSERAIHPETTFAPGVRAAAPGRSDSLETDIYEDAPETFETCSVGGSIDENEVLDDSHQVADTKLEEESQNLGVVPSDKEPSGKTIALDGQSNVLDHIGTSEVEPEDKFTQSSKMLFSGTSTEQDLKAPSPEAWQELGTSEVGRGNNETQTGELVQAAAPERSNTEVKNHQIIEKTHTPLRSLLAKEVAGKANQKHNSTENQAKAGGTWGSQDVGKPKTRSIWSHCICCPAVH